MPENLTQDKANEILQEAKDRWDICDSFYGDLYNECQEDWEFLHGDGQWEPGARDTRARDGRPCLVLNQCLPYAHQVTNDIKQARLAIRVVPIDSDADVETAEIRAGVIRNIEKQSDAKNVYGTAAMNAVGAGIGWMRIRIDYADNDTFDQEAFIDRVLDFSSVYVDPSDTSINGSTADYGFVMVSYTTEEFTKMFPDAEASSFNGISKQNYGDECVHLVEYYYKEKKKDRLYEVSVAGEIFQINGEDKKLIDEENSEIDKLIEAEEDITGREKVYYEVLREREIEVCEIYHCLLSGSEVLSREVFPSTYIPLVPVIGEEYWNEGKREFHSLIRQAKDAQRMYNYWKSASTEMIALQPKTPWVAPVGSFESYPDKWAAANTQNLPFIEYDVVRDDMTGQPLPPPQRAAPAQGSPALMQEAMAAREDIRLALGMPQANMGERSNAVSGIAIRSQQVEGDNATFHFIDNLTSSIAQVGRILNELIPVLYSDRKVARIIGDDGEESNVPVNTPYVETDEGMRPARAGEQPYGQYDLSVGKYDIDMDVGASYSSKRQETADKLIELVRARPDLADITGDLLFQALDLPMGKEIAERIKATMDPALLGDDPQAARLQAASAALNQMQEQLANYEAALADKQGDQQFERAAAAEKAQLERDKFVVDAEKTRADIAKIYSEIEKNNAETTGQVQENINQVIERVNDMQGAIEIMLGDVEMDIIERDAETPEPLIEGEMLTEEDSE